MLRGRVCHRDGVAFWRLGGAAAFCGLLLTGTFCTSAPAGWSKPPPLAGLDLLVTVLDENGLAVPSARLMLADQANSLVQEAETDYLGRYQFSRLSPGVYSLRVEKEGFLVFSSNDVRVAETSNLEVTLNHTREYAELAGFPHLQRHPGPRFDGQGPAPGPEVAEKWSPGPINKELCFQ